MYFRASTRISLAGFAALALVAAACDGGGDSPGGTPDAGGGRPDGSTGGLSDVLLPPGGGGGRDTGVGLEGGIGPVAPPTVVPGSVKILPTGSQLLGGITVGCSYGLATAAAGTRWCAFGRPGAQLGRWELWALNMNEAGVAKCEGAGSPGCVRLTDDLFGATPQAGPRFPTAHRWYGDTLIYHADAKSTASQAYTGPIYAWQPGWPTPKKISATDNAFRCVGHARANVALCLENLSLNENEPLTFDLTGGKIDGATTGVKVLAKIIPGHPVETDSSQWGAGFTADGKYILYSTGIALPAPMPQQPETLFYQEVDKIGVAGETAKQVGEPGVSSWDISPDATKWFYMKDYNYSPTAPSGSLWMADFPAGTNPVRIASPLIKNGSAGGVAGYDLVPTKDNKLAFVAVIQNYAGNTGDYIIIKDPAGTLTDPANVVKIRDGIPNFPVNSPDLRYGWYFQTSSMTFQGITDARILKNDATAGCTLTAATTAALFGTPFLETAALTFWIENYNADSDTGDGMTANPADCLGKKRKWGSAVDYWFIKGDEQMVYTDDVKNDVTSTLKVASFTAGDLGAPTIIQNQIERFFQVLPNQEGVIFQIRSGSSALIDGIYYRKLGATSGSDGGVSDAADAGAADAADAAAGN